MVLWLLPPEEAISGRTATGTLLPPPPPTTPQSGASSLGESVLGVCGRGAYHIFTCGETVRPTLYRVGQHVSDLGLVYYRVNELVRFCN